MKIIIQFDDFEIIHSSLDLVGKLKYKSASFNFFEFLWSKHRPLPAFVLPAHIEEEEIIFEFDDISHILNDISDTILIRGENIKGGEFFMEYPIIHSGSRLHSFLSRILPIMVKIISKNESLPTIHIEYFRKSIKIIFSFPIFDREKYSPILDLIPKICKVEVDRSTKYTEFLFDENSDLKMFENLVKIPFLPWEEREKKIRELENFKSLMSIL